MDQERLESGALCSLKMGRWDARAKIDVKKLGKTIPEEIVRASRDLIADREILGELGANRRECKRKLLNNSVPFPVDGVFFIPDRERIVKLDSFFTEKREKNSELVENLISNLSKLERDFKKRYPEYYDPSKYPSEARIRAKFYFWWNFFQITPPDGNSGILSPKMYKREAEKFKRMIQEMEEMTITLASNMISKRLNKLKEQCDSEKFNAGTINSINRLLGRWQELWSGHVDDKKFRSVMNSLRVQMKKTTSDRLKDNEDFRRKTEEKIGRILEDLKVVPDYKMKRRLDI